MNISKYEPYIIEVIRLFVLVSFVSIAGYFIHFLPFINELPFIKNDYMLDEFLEFVVFLVISFLLIEFSKRTQNIVDYMLEFIPKVGLIHKYIFFIISMLLLYSGGLKSYEKLVGKDWLWLYQMVFAGLVIFIISLIFLIIYREGDRFGKNLYSKIREIL